MADTRNIVIELKLQGTEGESDSETGKSENGEINLSDLLHPMRTITKKMFGNQAGFAMQIYSYTKQAVVSSARYEISKYFSLTENYSMQQDMDNALTAISKGASFGTSIISGAMMGAKAGGGYGAIAGAIIATVGWTVNEGIQIYQRFDQQNRALAGMNVQSQFQLTRMGLTDGGRNSLN